MPPPAVLHAATGPHVDEEPVKWLPREGESTCWRSWAVPPFTGLSPLHPANLDMRRRRQELELSDVDKIEAGVVAPFDLGSVWLWL